MVRPSTTLHYPVVLGYALYIDRQVHIHFWKKKTFTSASNLMVLHADSTNCKYKCTQVTNVAICWCHKVNAETVIFSYHLCESHAVSWMKGKEESFYFRWKHSKMHIFRWWRRHGMSLSTCQANISSFNLPTLVDLVVCNHHDILLLTNTLNTQLLLLWMDSWQVKAAKYFYDADHSGSRHSSTKYWHKAQLQNK